MMDVYQIGLCCLEYEKNVFTGPSLKSSFLQLYKIFGPTHPGHFGTQEQVNLTSK